MLGFNGLSLWGSILSLGGYAPFNQLGPTLDLSFTGVVTDLTDPNGYTLNTDFIIPQYQIAAQYVVWETGVGLVDKTFSQIITFTRASTGTFFDSAGVLQSAAIDAPRFDYDPSTLAAQGLLIEEARTNLCLQSQDLFETGTGGVNWIWPAGVVTGNTQTAPDGTTTADTVTSSGGAQSVYQSITVTASTAYTFSLFVKLGTMSASDYKIAFYNNTAAAFFATDVVPTQVPNTSGWTRINYAFTTPVGCTSVRVYPFRNSAVITSSTVFLWGAQLEAGAFPTSYIPTTTTALTRSADVASVNTLSPWYNASEGTLYVQAQDMSDAAHGTSQPRAASINNGTTSNTIDVSRLPASAQGRARVDDAGANQFNSLNSAWPLATQAKVALAYKVNDFAACLGGGTVFTDTSGTVPAVTALSIGNVAVGGGNGWVGWIQRVAYYPRRLSNAELQTITT